MKVELQEGMAVIIPDGNIGLGSSIDFKNELQAIFDAGCSEVAIDFTHVSDIDSSGVGKLLLLQKMLQDRGGKLRICNITSKKIHNIFNMIHLHKVITIEKEEMPSA